MGVHTELHNKADFDKAIATPDKYVFIYMYEGTVSPQAEEYAKKFSDTTAAYNVDVSKEPKVKEYFKVERIPAAVVYKDGKEIKKVEAMHENQEAMKEIGQMLSK